jgi:hypothetical protein
MYIMSIRRGGSGEAKCTRNQRGATQQRQDFAGTSTDREPERRRPLAHREDQPQGTDMTPARRTQKRRSASRTAHTELSRARAHLQNRTSLRAHMKERHTPEASLQSPPGRNHHADAG